MASAIYMTPIHPVSSERTPRYKRTHSVEAEAEATVRKGSGLLRSASTGTFSHLLRNRNQREEVDVMSISCAGVKELLSLKSCLSSGSLANDGIKKSVSFHQIEIREHERALGDNPSVSSGPALSVSWNSVDHTEMSVDDYEEFRPPRRCRSSLAVPRLVREDMLRKEGVSRSEMQAVDRQTNRIKLSRSQSVKSLNRPKVSQLFFKLLENKGSASDKQAKVLLAQTIHCERLRHKLKESHLAKQAAKELRKQQEHQSGGQSTLEMDSFSPTTVAMSPIMMQEKENDTSSVVRTFLPGTAAASGAEEEGGDSDDAWEF